MNKIFYLLLIMLTMSASSCKKFLDVKPADFLAPGNYYTTAEELQTAVNGVYNILTHVSLYRSGIVYLNGFEADEAYNNRASLINYPFTFDYTATNPTIESFWYGCYIGIGRANALLKNIDNNPDLAIAIRDKARGEALFLRGYYYFMLAQNFGGVPLLLDPIISAEDTEAPRATLKETYDQVLQDMEKAEAFVDDINISTSSKVSKSAVRGILARVCLSMAGAPLKDVTKYEAARKWSKLVIDDGVAGHRLNPSYADIFIRIARDEYDAKETIWEAEFWGNGSDAFGLAGNNGRILGPASTNANTGICPAYVNITGKLYDAYTAGDLRMPWCIPNFTYNSSGARGAKTYVAPPSRGDVYLKNVGKYRREYELALPHSYNNSTPSSAINPGNIANADLRWERTAQLNLGYDLGLFQNRIELTVDVYRKITSDLLLKADLPPTTGFGTAYKNIGKLKNQGIELSLNTVNIAKGPFTWQSNINITFNRNEILELTKGQQMLNNAVSFESQFSSALYVSAIGQPAGMFYGYVWDGVYQYGDFTNPSPGVYVLKNEIPANGNGRAVVQPGDIKYKDVNGDGTVNSMDMVVIGRGQPIHQGGFMNNFGYKGFNLSAFLQWSSGNQIYNANRLTFEGNSNGRHEMNQFATYTNRWTPDNPSNVNFRANGHGPIGYHSSRVLEDGSYLRLKTVSLGYSLPVQYIRRLHMSNLTITMSAQNLITWTKYSGMDPEVSARNSVLTPGFDFSAYPQARTLMFGLNATF